VGVDVGGRQRLPAKNVPATAAAEAAAAASAASAHLFACELRASKNALTDTPPQATQ
jgi:hypothetical protein